MIRSDEPLLPLISSIKRTANDINPSLVLTFTCPQDPNSRRVASSAVDGYAIRLLWRVGDDSGDGRASMGVISYMVVRRRNEIGVRIALGANRNDILVMVLKEAGILLVIGL